MKDLSNLIQRFEETREWLIMNNLIHGDTKGIELTANELRMVIKALRYYTYWHDLPEDPNQ